MIEKRLTKTCTSVGSKEKPHERPTSSSSQNTHSTSNKLLLSSEFNMTGGISQKSLSVVITTSPIDRYREQRLD